MSECLSLRVNGSLSKDAFAHQYADVRLLSLLNGNHDVFSFLSLSWPEHTHIDNALSRAQLRKQV